VVIPIDDAFAWGVRAVCWLWLSLAVVAALHYGWVPGLRFRTASRIEPPLWSLADALLIVLFHFGLLVVLGGAAMAIRDAFVGADGGGGGAAAAAGAAMDDAVEAGAARLKALSSLAMLTLTTVFTIALVYVVVRRGRGQPLSVVGLRGAPWCNLAPLLLFYVACFVPIFAVQVLWKALLAGLVPGVLETQAPVTEFLTVVRVGDAVAVTALVVAAVVVAPVLEEVVFRGVLFGVLQRRFGFAPACAISSVVFAAVHVNIAASVPLALVGAMLAYVYARTGSLWYAILWHAVFNGVNMAFMALTVLGHGG